MTKRKYPDAPAGWRPYHPRAVFWESFIPEPNSGCWLWLGCVGPTGYGTVFRGPGKKPNSERSHRWSWRIHHGPVPAGLHVLHKCDVRSCVNPDHLFLGTHTDNMHDMRRKGRLVNRRGEAHGCAKLTAAQVEAIRSSSGTNTAIAKTFGVGRTTISEIRLGKTWQLP